MRFIDHRTRSYKSWLTPSNIQCTQNKNHDRQNTPSLITFPCHDQVKSEFHAESNTETVSDQGMVLSYKARRHITTVYIYISELWIVTQDQIWWNVKSIIDLIFDWPLFTEIKKSNVLMKQNLLFVPYLLYRLLFLSQSTKEKPN